ncbi:MAG: hypothetical protein Q8L45_08435 [Xanthomonadaceae bacterium]|nr:hypothetical protein [Xanthomonadaceae bacterium]MDP2184271.1 hypothetical protein [Xanthomonadales bacterium]MDZ4114817.1 hypothetical protein [Xanthomonadaceae bacterium]MDZ4377396.1 hypothetical protein [Xanthomonadaceae bacterium]
MNSTLTRMILATALTFAAITAPPAALADEVKMVGTITEIQMAADGKSVIAILEHGKTGESVVITITDDLTLDKFKDERIVEGDEIRTKYDNAGGTNKSLTFKKTAGC